ncbi:MAG: hypothetical protein Q8O13_09305 [Candidatus Omnitrophota bacterium]|nr:hypothetical protein [Candidatus Omnitrophota bacterium]
MSLKVLDTAIGAFLGAFFAYFFMRVRDVFTQIYERQKENFNALVRLEYLCCENMDSISNNIWIIDDFDRTVGQALKQKQPAVYGNRLHELPFPEDILLKFTGIDFLNEILSYKVDFTRVNHDIETINSMYNSFKNALIQGTINIDTYLVNAQITLTKSLELKKFLQALEEKTIRIGAYARILCRDQKPFLTRIIQLTFKKKIFTLTFNAKVEKEIEQIKRDRAQVTAKSKEELDKISGRSTQQ